MLFKRWEDCCAGGVREGVRSETVQASTKVVKCKTPAHD